MKYTPITDEIHEYMSATFPAEDDFLRTLKREADEAGFPPIHIAPEQVAFLQMFLKATGAKRVLEIGALAGYSAVGMARALPEGSSLLTLEREPRHADFVRRKVREAGLENIVEVRTGDAAQLLREITVDSLFDFVFIDADKVGYTTYLDLTLPLVRVGGVICGDNTLAWGNIADSASTDKTVQALRNFNAAISAHPQLQACLLPIAEGMTFGVKVG
ncbi:MAG: O-methyltransferase [Candidatus Kapabacteria bacterium]|nr:O-methyltransferase [Candidatus Kapabacteria bacterium]